MTTELTDAPAGMTANDWATSTDPAPMLNFIAGRVSARKLTLWASSCWRRLFSSLIWSWRWRQRVGGHRRAVDAAELFADGVIAREWRDAARDGIGFELSDQDCPERALAQAAWLVSGDLAGAGAGAVNAIRAAEVLRACVRLVGEADPVAEAQAQADLLREVVGDPFRPFAVEPRWLSWQDGVVRRLAEEAYRRRLLPVGTLDDDTLGVLADALEDAGCGGDEALLAHLRAVVPHVPGCAAVDAVLGRC